MGLDKGQLNNFKKFWSSLETELTHMILNVEQIGKEQYKDFRDTRINKSDGSL